MLEFSRKPSRPTPRLPFVFTKMLRAVFKDSRNDNTLKRSEFNRCRCRWPSETKRTWRARPLVSRNIARMPAGLARRRSGHCHTACRFRARQNSGTPQRGRDLVPASRFANPIQDTIEIIIVDDRTPSFATGLICGRYNGRHRSARRSSLSRGAV